MAMVQSGLSKYPANKSVPPFFSSKRSRSSRNNGRSDAIVMFEPRILALDLSLEHPGRTFRDPEPDRGPLQHLLRLGKPPAELRRDLLFEQPLEPQQLSERFVLGLRRPAASAPAHDERSIRSTRSESIKWA